MKARQFFRSLIVVSVLAILMIALSLLGPYVIGLAYHMHDMDHVDGLLENILLVCFAQPNVSDWSVLLLVTLPLTMLIWIGIGSAFTLVGSWYKTRRLVRSLLTFASPVSSQPWAHLTRTTDLEGRVDLVMVGRPLAFCYGWLRPRICISSGAVEGLSEPEIAAILLHERYHLRRRDPLKSAISSTLTTVFFFLPVIRALRDQYMVAREIEADAYVLHKSTSNQALLSALCKLILRQRKLSRRREITAGVVATLGSAGTTGTVGTASYSDYINQRLDYLLTGKLPTVLRMAPALLSAFVLLAFIFLALVASWNTAANASWHQAYCTLTMCPMMH